MKNKICITYFTAVLGNMHLQSIKSCINVHRKGLMKTLTKYGPIHGVFAPVLFFDPIWYSVSEYQYTSL